MKILFSGFQIRYSDQTNKKLEIMGKSYKIEPMDIVKASKRAQRDEMISQGAQVLRATKVHKSLKDYRRKPKHQKDLYSY